MNLESLEKLINSELTTKINSSSINHDELKLKIDEEDLHSVILFLKNDTRTKFRQLIDITAVDYPERDTRFKLIYFLLSHENNLRLNIEFEIKENYQVKSITSIFPSSNWMEREVFDMYGIHYKDHPDLRRILTDYGFEGHPMRKDFPLSGYVEFRYDETRKKIIGEPVELAQEFRTFTYEMPW